MGKLFEELKKRKVFRVAAIYAVVAWVLIQVSDVVLPTFEAPAWVNQTIIFLFILGFIPTLIAAWAYDLTPEGITAGVASQPIQAPSNSTDRKLIYAILVLVLLVAGFQVAERFVFDTNSNNTALTPTPGIALSGAQVTRTLFSFGNMQYRPFENVLTNFDFTPDGSQLVYSSYLNGNNRLHVRNLAELEPQTILQSNTLTMFSPKVSPDGEQIIFITANFELYTLRLNGSATPTLVARGVTHESYDWFGDRDVIFTESGIEKLQTVSVTGGTPQLVILENPDLDNGRHKTPLLLPGGNFLIYSAIVGQRNSRVELLDLSTNQNRVLIENGFAAKYVDSGHLVFMRGDNLMAVPFDLDQMTITGREAMIVSGIENFSAQSLAAYSFSSNGQLLYLPGSDRSKNIGLKEFVRADASGEQSKLNNWPVQQVTDPVLSPDGTRVALTINESDGRDIWEYHLERRTLSRVTYSGDSHEPLWSPDGQTLVFEDGRSGLGLWQINANGAGVVEKLITTTSRRTLPKAFSPDGSKLIYMQQNESWDFNMLDFDDPEIIQQPLINSEFTEFDADVSPNGQWLAYKSNETGRFEVYVRPFPDVNAGKTQVSINGGSERQWSYDENSLFYIDDDESTLVAVPVGFESGFTFGAAVTMASVASPRVDPPSYMLLPDDQSFLIQIDMEGIPSAHVPRAVNAVLVDNWIEELNRLAPPDLQ